MTLTDEAETTQGEFHSVPGFFYFIYLIHKSLSFESLSAMTIFSWGWPVKGQQPV